MVASWLALIKFDKILSNFPAPLLADATPVICNLDDRSFRPIPAIKGERL